AYASRVRCGAKLVGGSLKTYHLLVVTRGDALNRRQNCCASVLTYFMYARLLFSHNRRTFKAYLEGKRACVEFRGGSRKQTGAAGPNPTRRKVESARERRVNGCSGFNGSRLRGFLALPMGRMPI